MSKIMCPVCGDEDDSVVSNWDRGTADYVCSSCGFALRCGEAGDVIIASETDQEARVRTLTTIITRAASLALDYRRGYSWGKSMNTAITLMEELKQVNGTGGEQSC